MTAQIVLNSEVVEVQGELAHLARLVDKAMQSGTQVLTCYDEQLARQMSAADSRVNLSRLALEEHCYELLKTCALSEADVRMIVAMVNVATNLERIADHVVGNAHLMIRLAVGSSIQFPAVVTEMSEIARELVKSSIEAFLTRNDMLAENVVRRGREIDDLQEQVYLLLHEQQPPDTSLSIPTLWIARNLERIGDRVGNICERTVYVTTGEMKEFR